MAEARKGRHPYYFAKLRHFLRARVTPEEGSDGLPLPAVLPEPLVTPPFASLPADVAAAVEIYVEPKDAGKLLPPGKRTTMWGPDHWPVFDMLWSQVWGRSPRRRREFARRLVAAAQLHIECTPFGLVCGVCRWSNSLIMALNPVRALVHTPADAAAFYCLSHTVVNAKFNLSPPNAALPRKQWFNYDQKSRTCTPISEPYEWLPLSEVQATYKVRETPSKSTAVLETAADDATLQRVFSAMLFRMLFYMAAHYPAFLPEHVFVVRQRRRIRMLLAQWCHVLPLRWALARALATEFALDAIFHALCHDETTRIATLDAFAAEHLDDSDPSWGSSDDVILHLRSTEERAYAALGMDEKLPTLESHLARVQSSVVSRTIPLSAFATPAPVALTPKQVEQLLQLMSLPLYMLGKRPPVTMAP